MYFQCISHIFPMYFQCNYVLYISHVFPIYFPCNVFSMYFRICSMYFQCISIYFPCISNVIMSYIFPMYFPYISHVMYFQCISAYVPCISNVFPYISHVFPIYFPCISVCYPLSWLSSGLFPAKNSVQAIAPAAHWAAALGLDSGSSEVSDTEPMGGPQELHGFIAAWWLVWNMFYFPWYFRDVIRPKLMNSIIFQDG